jgi:hypothetical protein
VELLKTCATLQGLPEYIGFELLMTFQKLQKLNAQVLSINLIPRVLTSVFSMHASPESGKHDSKLAWCIARFFIGKTNN